MRKLVFGSFSVLKLKEGLIFKAYINSSFTNALQAEPTGLSENVLAVGAVADEIGRHDISLINLSTLQTRYLTLRVHGAAGHSRAVGENCFGRVEDGVVGGQPAEGYGERATSVHQGNSLRSTGN